MVPYFLWGIKAPGGPVAGSCFSISVAWNGPSIDDAEYPAAWHHLVLPIAYEFNPELVLVSLKEAQGYLLGDFLVSTEGYDHLIQMLISLASGLIILVLEGGYNLTSIWEYMATTCTLTLFGDPLPC
uniref:Histone deacetylase domain-containing protein n=1 Tax=Molossus molossus TaxID=27622 RepID=A0A7J8DTT7_MOLMO|nr:hypothetical protein HJG59_009150 [Molossus molossus]